MESIDTRATEPKEISQEFISLLERLEELINAYKTTKISQILLYIDGTNGDIFCSGIDQESEEPIDETMICFSMIELLEQLEENGFGAMDFDVISEKSIKKAFISMVGNRLKSNFKVIIENEDGAKTIL